MACSCNGNSGAGCAAQYGSTCPGHLCNVRLGGVYSLNRPKTNWSDHPVSNQVYIKKNHLLELRTALNAELSVRSLSLKSWSDTEYFTSKQWLEIRDAINECRRRDGGAEFVYHDPYEPGDVITPIGMNYLRNFVNLLQTVCMCQCNYDCACNCNYCTCNCNYCTCNCNWGCPCDCAYSDKRLKEKIKYL